MINSIEIIAEVAQGYEGNKKLLQLLTKAGIKSTADAVKYQLVYADELATPDYKYYDLFSQLEMDDDDWKEVANQIHANGQKLYFDVFGEKSLEVAKLVGADGIKLSTTEFYNRRLIEKSLDAFGNIYLSVGGIPENDIDTLMSEILGSHSEQICLIYGFQSEPTPLEQNNLLKLQTFKSRYPKFRIGFMDHSDGEVEDGQMLGLVAMGTGISCIEKHITLDRSLEIEDFVSGLTPSDFVKFAERIRKFESALGSPSLDLSELEHAYRKKASKVVVSLIEIGKGEELTLSNVALKRTGIEQGGEFINSLESVLGSSTLKTIPKNHPIFKGEIE